MKPRRPAAPEATPEPLTPFSVMDAPELAALALLENAIDVARIAVLAQHADLLDPDAPYWSRRATLPGANLTTAFFAHTHALWMTVRRYRAAVAASAVVTTPDDHDDF